MAAARTRSRQVSLKGLFALPSRTELKRAALLSLLVTALSLIWPLAALAQEVAAMSDDRPSRYDLVSLRRIISERLAAAQKRED